MGRGTSYPMFWPWPQEGGWIFGRSQRWYTKHSVGIPWLYQDQMGVSENVGIGGTGYPACKQTLTNPNTDSSRVEIRCCKLSPSQRVLGYGGWSCSEAKVFPWPTLAAWTAAKQVPEIKGCIMGHRHRPWLSFSGVILPQSILPKTWKHELSTRKDPAFK